MGHEIHYMNCDENCNRRQVMDEIQTYSRLHGDGYHSSLTWHDNVGPLDSYEAAKKFIEEHENNKWDDHAVRFYDYSRTEKSATYSVGYTSTIGAEQEIQSYSYTYDERGFLDALSIQDCYTADAIKLTHDEKGQRSQKR